jgi:hypothetical protein
LRELLGWVVDGAFVVAVARGGRWRVDSLSIDRLCEIRDAEGVFSEADRGRLHRDLTATVGRAPLVELRRLAKDLPGRVAAKLEMRNPGGSVKDRLAVALVDDAACSLRG